MRILHICESHDHLPAVETAALTLGYHIDTTNLNTGAVDLLNLSEYRVVVIDTRSLGSTSNDALRTLRDFNRHVPVLVIHGSEIDRDAKDDHPFFYVKLPISEKLLRDQITVAASVWGASKQPKISVGSLVIDTDWRLAWIDKVRLQVIGKQFDILAMLALNHGRKVPTQRIFDKLYGDLRTPPQKRCVYQKMYLLRKKVELIAPGRFQITGDNRGYVLQVNA